MLRAALQEALEPSPTELRHQNLYLLGSAQQGLLHPLLVEAARKLQVCISSGADAEACRGDGGVTSCATFQTALCLGCGTGAVGATSSVQQRSRCCPWKGRRERWESVIGQVLGPWLPAAARLDHAEAQH